MDVSCDTEHVHHLSNGKFSLSIINQSLTSFYSKGNVFLTMTFVKVPTEPHKKHIRASLKMDKGGVGGSIIYSYECVFVGEGHVFVLTGCKHLFARALNVRST